MRDRIEAAYPVGQQRPERGARLHPHIPVAGGGGVFPVNLAEIVEDGNGGGGREVGIGEF